jgi:hypothetical protein
MNDNEGKIQEDRWMGILRSVQAFNCIIRRILYKMITRIYKTQESVWKFRKIVFDKFVQQLKHFIF